MNLLFNEGKSITEIATILDVDRHTVARHLVDKSKYNENCFSTITAESAYWLGFMYADGYVGSTRNTVGISLMKSDFNHLQKFSKFILYKGNCVRIFHGKSSFGDHYYCRVNLRNKKMHDDLVSLGCVSLKTHILQFPKFMYKSEYLKDFVRGFFDGDGCLSLDKRGNRVEASFICAVELFIIDLQAAIKILGFESTKSKSNKCHRIRVKNAFKFLDFIYKDAAVYLDRKFEKYYSLKQRREGRLME